MSDIGVAESVVEQATLAWLEALGWHIVHGPDIAPDTFDALLVADSNHVRLGPNQRVTTIPLSDLICDSMVP